MFSVICIFLTKNQWFERKYIALFYQVVMERVLWGPNYPVFAVQSYQRAVEYINVDDVVAFCLYLMKKSGGLSLSSLFVRFYKYNRNNRLVVDEEGKQSNCGCGG